MQNLKVFELIKRRLKFLIFCSFWILSEIVSHKKKDVVELILFMSYLFDCHLNSSMPFKAAALQSRVFHTHGRV